MICIKNEDKLKTLRHSCELLEKRLDEILSDSKQFNRYIVNEKQGGNTVCKEEVFKKADDKALKNIVGILKETADIKRTLFEIEDEGKSGAQTGVILIPEVSEK